METKSETRKVGKYELVSRLGEGSYAKVYKGRDDTTGTEYALKVISKDKLGTGFIALALNYLLTHPNNRSFTY